MYPSGYIADTPWWGTDVRYFSQYHRVRRRAACAGWLLGALLLVAGCQPGGAATLAEAPVVHVFAAASLTDVLPAVVGPYRQRTGVVVRFTFASSSTLARQIDSGAGADLFLSADEEWMDYLDERHRLRAGSRVDLLGNRLVLIAPADSALTLVIRPGFGLAAALHGGRLAVGDPDSVPAGRYARAALTSLGVWQAVAERLVRAENVRGALQFVARGEVPLGIVYATDATADPRVRIVDVFPAESHPPIRYPLAETDRAAPAARELAKFLLSAEARGAFAAAGFIAPASPTR